VLLKLPQPGAVVIGVAATYWSWCLAMYRDVEQGLGVLESVIHISTGGPQLPWMTTLSRLGYLPAGLSPLLVLAITGGIVWAIWRAPLPGPAIRFGQPRPGHSGKGERVLQTPTAERGLPRRST
jgi:hypothetical protein